MSAFRESGLNGLAGHLATGRTYGGFGLLYWGLGRGPTVLVTFLRFWYLSALFLLQAQTCATKGRETPMYGEAKLFYPYKSYGQFDGQDCDEDFSIEVLEENLELGYRTVRTPEGMTAYIWHVVAEGKPAWKIFFLMNDACLFLEYFSLQTFWPHCEESMRSLNQARERELLYSAQQRKFIGVATRPVR